MAKWEQVEIIDAGVKREAQAPIVISASRSTDIPAFYSEWLRHRIEAGFVKWTNPFNGVPMYVSFANARAFVFWTKNPKPMFETLDFLDERNLNYYFQFTLNDYDDEKYEPGVPSVEERVETFIQLSKRLGKDRVIWRFDPLLLTDRVSVDLLLEKIAVLGTKIAPYTSRFIFSFADIDTYAKVKRNLRQANVIAREFTVTEMKDFASGIQELNRSWKLPMIGTCAEKVDLEMYGIEHTRCIDDRLLARLFPSDAKLMNFLGYEVDLFGNLVPAQRRKKLTDSGQREACGCIRSKDIGEYNTCPHLCLYCYANASKNVVLKNYIKHIGNRFSESIRGQHNGI